MTYSFQNLLLLFSIFQLSLAGIVLLLIKDGNTIANKFLSGFFIAKAICFAFDFLKPSAGSETNFMFLVLHGFAFDLALGPSIYFYIKKSTFNEVKIDKILLLNFTPFILFFLINNIFQLIYLVSSKNFTVFYKAFFNNLFITLTTTVVYLHFIIYSILSYKLLSYYKEYLKKNFAQAQLNHLRWLQFLLGGFIFIWAVNIISIFIVTDKNLLDILFTFTIAGIFVFANSVVLIAIRFPEVFQNKIAAVRRKYEKTLLDSDEKEVYLKKLTFLMNEEKIFRSNTLSLAEIAEKLKVQNHIVSQIINSEFGKNFYDFVNYYRVEECKKMLADNSCNSKTILEIAYECGFNSKSVFNNSFKKLTGKTPSDYKRDICTKN